MRALELSLTFPRETPAATPGGMELPLQLEAGFLADLAHILDTLDGWLATRDELLAAGTNVDGLDGLILDTHQVIQRLRGILTE
jgi:hypothetical protein